MNKQEYLDKRNALYDKAKKLIAENKLAEAKEITQQIDKLDSDFENSAVGKANKNAEEGIKMPAPFENHKANIDLTDEDEKERTCTQHLNTEKHLLTIFRTVYPCHRSL